MRSATVSIGYSKQRISEADEFYSNVMPPALSADAQNVFRQAMGGLFWSKQFYHYDVRTWLEGDPGGPPPPPERAMGRNHTWTHLYNADVISMPDKWEYPWYAAWDTAFHCVAIGLVDPDYAKEQLILLLREWYQHPNGQLPLMSGLSAMLILPFTRGRRGASTKSKSGGEASPTGSFSRKSFTSYC